MGIISDIILLSVFSIFVLWWFRKSKKNQHFYKNIPTPPTIPLLGNALDLGSTTKLLDAFMKYTREYGDIVKIHIGPVRKFILVSDYKFLEAVLSTTKLLNKSNEYRFIHSWLGTGLLTSDGPKWKKHRRILTPAFHFQILETFIDVFESCGDILIKKLEKKIGEQSFDIYPLVTLLTLDIICESTMGTNVDAQNNENSDYVRSVKDMGRIMMERVISPIQRHDFLFRLTKNYYTQKKALEILHAHTNSVIVRRRKELENRVENNHKRDESFTKNKKPFLDLLLEATVEGQPLTQDEIREEVDTFMFEGHDTTASAISFALFCLANNPDVQETALEEQKAIFGEDKNPSVKYGDLQNMKFLEQVIKETLRLYPSVPVYSRETNEDMTYNNVALPQGDALLIFAYGIQRNPKYFEKPDEFNPNRFENIDGKLPYAYIPFSAGPRNCIGQKFAMLEMKSTISKILRKFELRPAFPQHTLILAAEAVLKSNNGIKISLKLRS